MWRRFKLHRVWGLEFMVGFGDESLELGVGVQGRHTTKH